VPVPVKVSTVGEFAASLIKDMDPEAAPAVDGVKSTLNETLCPGDTVTGKVIPLTE
jgi:hypothetical protein